MGVLLALLVAAAAAGCIKPTADATPTPGAPGAVGAALPTAAVAVPSAPAYPQIEQFIRDRGQNPAQLIVWYDQPRDPDRLQGFSYQNDADLPCAGFMLTSQVSGVWQPTYGAQICAADAAAQALAGVTFFPTSAGEVYTVIFGRTLDPTITAVAVVFDDGANQMVSPVQGGYLLVRGGVASVAVITAINAEGNTVIQNIPQTPV